MPSSAIQALDARIKALSQAPGFEAAQGVVEAVIGLLGIDAAGTWRLFNDSGRKLRDNSHWFMKAEEYADRLATYELAKENGKNLDLKVYWTKKIEKSVIHWITALTPNFEDAPYLASENVGIDFVIPETADRVLVILSKEHVLRVIELKDKLTYTAHDIFGQWEQELDFSNKAQLHAVLWKSFDFEPTNRTFYKKISSFFTEQKQHLLSNCPDLFSDNTAALFTNRLIGRLIFCWFLEKKDVVNREVGYFEVGTQDATAHYRTKLEPLFFDVLNTPIEERASGTDTTTPFLNGGLFEAKETDYKGQDCVRFPADYFDRLFNDLNHYNFTTDESSSTYQQVAIDPEMLGRIFENLLAEQREDTGEQARKAKGAFYTPREIVDFMCRESLREYLKSAIAEVPGRDEQLSKLLDKMPHEFRDQQRNYRRDLQPFKHDLLKALEELTVLDPACGSGAFPMGALQLLLEVHERLESDFDPYKKKLTIIKNNIFGVDIEPMAVEIARLRAWLSIIVDEEGESDRIEPLPNLDFKFICANTLVPLSESKGAYDDLDDEKLIEIRDEYFRARKLSRKLELRDKYQKALYGKKGTEGMFASDREKQLKTYHPFKAESISGFFDLRVMFGIEEGFNIVIGNPPYVDNKKIKKEHKEIYKESYKSAYKLYDLSVLFIERSLNLLGKQGLLFFITTNKFLAADYGIKIREILYHETSIKVIVDVSNLNVFKEVAAFPVIIGISKRFLEDNQITVFPNIDEIESFTSRFESQAGSISQKDLVFNDDLVFNIKGNTVICKKIAGPNTLPLRDIKHLFTYRPFGFTDWDSQVDLLTDAPSKRSMKLVSTPSVLPYEVDWNAKVRISGAALENKYLPYNSKYEGSFEKLERPNILVKEVGKSLIAAYSEGQYAHFTGIYSLEIMDSRFRQKYVLALLNSKVIRYFYHSFYGSIHLTGGYLKINSSYLKNLPIALAPLAAQDELVKLVDEAIKAGQSGNGGLAEIEKKINKKVYEIYGIDEEERELIEKG